MFVFFMSVGCFMNELTCALVCGTVWVIVAETEKKCVPSYLVVWYLGGQGFSQHHRRQVRPAAGRVSQIITTW